MGRRSSLRDSAHVFRKVLDANKGRAQEKTGPPVRGQAPLGMTRMFGVALRHG